MGRPVLEPVKLGNVFLDGEAVRVGANVRGGAAWSLKDVAGDTVAQGRKEPGEGEIRPALPPGERGHYLLSVTADDGGEAATSLAVLRPFDLGAVPDSPFGVCTHFGHLSGPDTDLDAPPKESHDAIPLLGLAGFKTHRDELTWKRTEPVKGRCVFPHAHGRHMAGCGEHGVDSLVILDYGNKNYDGGLTPYTDEGLDGFANYARQIVRRYGRQIKEVEVWNEFNGSFSKGPAAKRPEAYMRLLERTYHALKAERPDLRIVGPAAVTLPYGWLEQLFSLGALRYLDAVSVHPYIYPRQPDTARDGLDSLLGRVHEIVRRHNGGVTKPLQLTEVGWPTHRGGVSVREQARYAVRALVLALSAGTERVYWYNLVSSGPDPAKREHNFGLVRHPDDPRGPYTPKPAYVALAVAARELSGARFVGREGLPDPLYSYLFERDGEELRVMWAAKRGGQPGGAEVPLRTGGPLTVTDLYGRVRRLEPGGRDVTLPLSESPVYVAGPSAVGAPGGAPGGLFGTLRRLFG